MSFVTRPGLGAVAFRDPIASRRGLGDTSSSGSSTAGTVSTVASIVNTVVGLFKGGSSAVGNPNAAAITNKWYNWYLGRAADAAGASWWPGQINADGVANAWMNFSTSAEPVAKGAAQKAQLYQSLGYGAPTDPPPVGTNPLVAPPTTVPYSQAVSPTGVPTALLTGAPAQASVLGGLSSSTLLLVGGGLLVGLMLMNRRSSRGQ